MEACYFYIIQEVAKNNPYFLSNQSEFPGEI